MSVNLESKTQRWGGASRGRDIGVLVYAAAPQSRRTLKAALLNLTDLQWHFVASMPELLRLADRMSTADVMPVVLCDLRVRPGDIPDLWKALRALRQRFPLVLVDPFHLARSLLPGFTDVLTMSAAIEGEPVQSLGLRLRALCLRAAGSTTVRAVEPAVPRSLPLQDVKPAPFDPQLFRRLYKRLLAAGRSSARDRR